MSVNRDEVWSAIKPFVAGLIDARIANATLASGVPVGSHSLAGTQHTGTLDNSQAPQFLLRDGTRSLQGNMAVDSGITIDGVDISAFKALYDAHIINPDAHHTGFVGLTGDSGSAVPNGSDLIQIVGGNGLVSSASGSALTVNMGTPITLSVSTANAFSGDGHSHAITTSSSPGPGAAIMATSSVGSFSFDTTLLDIDADNDRVGVGMMPTAARLDITGGSAEAAVRIQSGATTANAMEWLANSLTTGALVNATLPADRTLLQGRVSGDTVPRVALSQEALLFGPGNANVDAVLRRSAAGEFVMDDNGLGGAVDLSVSRKGTFGSTTAGTAMLTAQNPGGEHLRLAYDSSNYASFFVDNGGSLTVQPTGDVIFNPAGDDVRPQTNYDLNFGLINRKWLTLHAAELWVETLVAQNTIATIGGRIMVGPTTQLAADLALGTDATITRRSTSNADDIGSTALASLPAGTTTGDVLVIFLAFHHGTATVSSAPAGARLVRSVKNSANTAQLFVYILPISGAPPTISFTMSTSAAFNLHVLCYQNARATTFPEDVSIAQGNSSSTSVTVSATTTSATNTMLIYAGMAVGGGTMTPPSGMTEVLETLEGNAAQLLLETAEVLLPTASSTSTRTGTASVASSNAAAVIALAPAITSSVSVKHNQMAPGDVVYMEANGFVEFMSVASGPTGTGPYSYTMNRNLDGTGQNTWYAGDAIFNTGVAGNGFIDLFSLSGVNGRFLNYIYSYDNGAATTPFESGTYGSNVALEHDYQYLPSSLAANDAMYFGATTRWNNLYLYLTTIASWNIATVWEYWDGVAWVTFSPTITGAFTTLGSVNIEWAETALTSWAPKTINGQTAYWVRNRVSTVTSVTTMPRQGDRKVYWRKRAYGPTIVGNVRNSTTFNDWSEHWAIGNLNGVYDYANDVYGFAAGKYNGPASTTPWISADATNGFRVMRGSTKLAQWDTSGNITVGQVASGQGNVFISSGSVQTRMNTVVKLDAQTDGDLFIGTNTAAPATTFFSLFANAQTYNSESMASGDLLIGNNTTGQANIKWTPANGRLNFRGDTTVQLYIDTDGSLSFGSGAGRADSTGIRLIPYNVSKPWASTGSQIRWIDTNIANYIYCVDQSMTILNSVSHASFDPLLTLAASDATEGLTTTIDITKNAVSISGGTTNVQSLNVLTSGAAFGDIRAAGVFYPGGQATYYLTHVTAPFGLAHPGLSTNGSVSGTAMLASNWYRSIGATGWYNETYGGGIYMAGTTYVEVYNGKGFYVPGQFYANGSFNGIGVAPISGHRLTVQGATAAAGNYALVVRNSSAANLMYLENNGTAWVNTTWTVSDIQAKRDFRPIEGALDTVRALRDSLSIYTRKLSGMQEAGFLAQRVQEVLPMAVTKSTLDKQLGVSLPTLQTFHMAAFLEQDEVVQALIKRIEVLEEKIRDN